MGWGAVALYLYVVIAVVVLGALFLALLVAVVSYVLLQRSTRSDRKRHETALDRFDLRPEGQDVVGIYRGHGLRLSQQVCDEQVFCRVTLSMEGPPRLSLSAGSTSVGPSVDAEIESHYTVSAESPEMAKVILQMPSVRRPLLALAQRGVPLSLEKDRIGFSAPGDLLTVCEEWLPFASELVTSVERGWASLWADVGAKYKLAVTVDGIRGRAGGVPLDIRVQDGGVTMRATLRRHLSEGTMVTTRGNGQGMSQALGHDELDRLLWVRTSDTHDTGVRLGTPRVTAALSALIDRYPTTVIHESYVTVATQRRPIGSELEMLIVGVVELIRALEGRKPFVGTPIEAFAASEYAGAVAQG